MIVKTYCYECECIRLVQVEQQESRWNDESIDDCDLSSVELIARFNGESLTRYKCLECFNTWEEL